MASHPKTMLRALAGTEGGAQIAPARPRPARFAPRPPCPPGLDKVAVHLCGLTERASQSGRDPHAPPAPLERWGTGASSHAPRTIAPLSPLPVIRRLGVWALSSAGRAGAVSTGQHQAGVRGRPCFGHVSVAGRAWGREGNSMESGHPTSRSHGLSPFSPSSSIQRHLGPLLHCGGLCGDGRPEPVPGRQGGGGKLAFGGRHALCFFSWSGRERESSAPARPRLGPAPASVTRIVLLRPSQGRALPRSACRRAGWGREDERKGAPGSSS